LTWHCYLHEVVPFLLDSASSLLLKVHLIFNLISVELQSETKLFSY